MLHDHLLNLVDLSLETGRPLLGGLPSGLRGLSGPLGLDEAGGQLVDPAGLVAHQLGKSQLKTMDSLILWITFKSAQRCSFDLKIYKCVFF